MYALQSERKTTDGTPTDASIAVHLPDVDFIVSADKNFVSMANRCHEEGPSISGKGFLISGGEKGIEQLFEFIQNSGESKKEISILKNSHMGAEFPAGYF
jgi:hypothetical protein